MNGAARAEAPLSPRSVTLPGAHDLSLHALEWSASGPPLLLLHGFGNGARVWDDVVAGLAARAQYRTLALDQRGHGDSDRDPRARYSHEALARDLARVADALGPERVALVGHSMGAYAALHFAAAQPERVAALVLVDATADLHAGATARMRFRRAARDPSFDTHEAYARVLERSFPRASAAALERLARHGLRRRDDGRLAPKLDPAFLRPRHGYDPSRDRETWAARESRFLWDALGRVACPALVVRGAESPLLTADTARRMAGRALRRGRAVEIAGAGHAVMLDAPAALAAALDGFLCEEARVASHA